MIFKVHNIIISLYFSFIVFAINFVVPSGINGFPESGLNFNIYNIFKNNDSETVFWERYNDSEFRRRPFVLESQKILNYTFKAPFQLSFNILNFLFLFLLFLILPYLGYILGSPIEDSIYGQIYLLISMPIIFAFLANMCSYDDLLQYFLISCFLVFYILNYFYLSILFLLLCCICRETSVIFFLLILFNEYSKNGVRSLVSAKLIGSILFILITYSFFINIYVPEDILTKSRSFLLERRFMAWKENFGNFIRLRESISIIFIQLSLVTLILSRKIRKSTNLNTKVWYKFLLAFLYSNCIIVCFTGLVREARLIFLPMILIIPLLQSDFRQIMKIMPSLILRSTFVKSFIIIILCYIIAFVWFTPYSNGTGLIYKTYFFVYLFMFFNIIFISPNILFKNKNILKTGYFKK